MRMLPGRTIPARLQTIELKCNFLPTCNCVHIFILLHCINFALAMIYGKSDVMFPWGLALDSQENIHVTAVYSNSI